MGSSFRPRGDLTGVYGRSWGVRPGWYADFGDGPGEGLRRPPLGSPKGMGRRLGFEEEVSYPLVPGVGARSILPRPIGDAERSPAATCRGVGGAGDDDRGGGSL